MSVQCRVQENAPQSFRRQEKGQNPAHLGVNRLFLRLRVAQGIFANFTRTRNQFLALKIASHGCLREPAAHPCVTLILRQKELHHFADASYIRNIGGQTLRLDQHANAGQNFSPLLKPTKRTLPFQNFAKCKGSFEIKNLYRSLLADVSSVALCPLSIIFLGRYHACH